MGTPLKLLPQETAVIVALFAAKQTGLLVRYGDAELTLDPFPGSIGGDVGGEVLLHIPYHPNISSEVELELIQDEVKKEKNSYTTLWKEGGVCRGVITCRRIEATIPFFCASQPSSKRYFKQSTQPP